MSRFIIILLLAIISGSNKLAAQIDSAQFLLRNFENGYVYYKDGRTFNVPLNYSLLIKKFLFQDQHDNNNIKEFSEPEMVATIKIGERIFLPTKDGATEVLQKDPPIFVQYRGALKWEGKQVGYGGRSETSAVDSYSSFQSGNTTHKLETEKLILKEVAERDPFQTYGGFLEADPVYGTGKGGRPSRRSEQVWPGGGGGPLVRNPG